MDKKTKRENMNEISEWKLTIYASIQTFPELRKKFEKYFPEISVLKRQMQK